MLLRHKKDPTSKSFLSPGCLREEEKDGAKKRAERQKCTREEKVDVMNEENGEQTQRKRPVQREKEKEKERCVNLGEQGGQSDCIIGVCAHIHARTHTHLVPFSPQLWSDALVAATLASSDMQSGPISSTVCRKWHVPPEEAQKQQQPAINHASVSLCVCACVVLDTEISFMNYKLISSLQRKKTTLIHITSLKSLRNEFCPSLQENIDSCIHCIVFSPVFCCQIGRIHNTNSRISACCFWFDSFWEVLDYFLCVVSLLADWWASKSTSGGFDLYQRAQQCLLFDRYFIRESSRYKTCTSKSLPTRNLQLPRPIHRSFINTRQKSCHLWSSGVLSHI